MPQMLEPIGYSESLAGYNGLVMTITGVSAGLLAGRLADLYRNLKRLLVVLFATAFCCFGGFALLSTPGSPGNTHPPHELVIAFILITFTGTCVSATNGLFYELAVEITYPVNEDQSGLFLAVAANVVNLIMYLVRHN